LQSSDEESDEADEAERRILAVIESVIRQSTPPLPENEPNEEVPSFESIPSPPISLPTEVRDDEESLESDDDQEPVAENWTEGEKNQLLEAVKIYGAQDISRIQTMVNTRSMIEILKYMSTRKKKSKEPEIATAIERNANKCPDAQLQEWQQIANFLFAGRKDYSTAIVKKLSQDKFWAEELKNQERGAPFADGQLSFGRIYLHLNDAVEGKEKISLTSQEKAIVEYLIQDLSNCVRSVANVPQIKDLFGKILSSYRNNKSLAAKQTGASSSSFSADALCSLNPFCIPSDLLLELPSSTTRGRDEESHFDDGSTMDGADSVMPFEDGSNMESMETDDGYQTSANQNGSNETDVILL